MLKRFYFTIDEDNHRKRVDEFLFGQFSEIGKRFFRVVLKEKKCEVNGFTVNGGHILKRNDFLEIEFDFSTKNKMFPEEIPLDIVFEDADIIVLNKPAGMLIHPTPRKRKGTLLNGLLFYLNQEQFSDYKLQLSDQEKAINNGQQTNDYENGKSAIRIPKSAIARPGLIHRLDRQTSGLVVIAKTPQALRVLNSHFKRKLVEKKYLAVVEGVFKEDEGAIEAPIGRYEEWRVWNVKADGKAAETKFRVIERFANTTLLELEPITGRTNQLRIHCAYIGHPILGDEWHGKRKFPRLCLHAAKLGFWHPTKSERVEFEALLPDEIKVLLNQEN